MYKTIYKHVTKECKERSIGVKKKQKRSSTEIKRTLTGTQKESKGIWQESNKPIRKLKRNHMDIVVRDLYKKGSQQESGIQKECIRKSLGIKRFLTGNFWKSTCLIGGQQESKWN